ncbi:MAG: DUF5657 family protein [Patescibacteria group bacterium]
MIQPPSAGFFNALFTFGSSGEGPLLLVKLFIMFGLTVYVVFGLVVIRQVSLMTRTIKSSITPTIRLLGYVHMIVAIVVWFVALIIL